MFRELAKPRAAIFIGLGLLTFICVAIFQQYEVFPDGILWKFGLAYLLIGIVLMFYRISKGE